MINFVDLSMIEDLEDWQLDRALNTCEERLVDARKQLELLNMWNALQEDLDDCQADLKELANCKGVIRAEITRRRPYSGVFT